MAVIDADQAMVANLRVLLGMHGVQQQQLADYLGISKQAVWQLATGRLKPSLKTARAISQAFGIGTDDLFAPTEELVAAAAAGYATAPIRQAAAAPAGAKRGAHPV